MKTRTGIRIMLISLLSFFIFSFPILTNNSPAFAGFGGNSTTTTDNHETTTTTDNSAVYDIIVDGQGNTIIITGDSATIAPKPNDVEMCSPAVYNGPSATFIVPNVEIVDANGTKTEFVEVIFKLDPATGELKLLYAEQ